MRTKVKMTFQTQNLKMKVGMSDVLDKFKVNEITFFYELTQKL